MEGIFKINLFFITITIFLPLPLYNQCFFMWYVKVLLSSYSFLFYLHRKIPPLHLPPTLWQRLTLTNQAGMLGMLFSINLNTPIYIHIYIEKNWHLLCDYKWFETPRYGDHHSPDTSYLNQVARNSYSFC